MILKRQILKSMKDPKAFCKDIERFVILELWFWIWYLILFELLKTNITKTLS